MVIKRVEEKMLKACLRFRLENERIYLNPREPTLLLGPYKFHVGLSQEPTKKLVLVGYLGPRP